MVYSVHYTSHQSMNQSSYQNKTSKTIREQAKARLKTRQILSIYISLTRMNILQFSDWSIKPEFKYYILTF